MSEEQPDKVEPRIVETVAVSANTGNVSLSGGAKQPIAKFYERVMTEAIAQAQEAGITDPEELRAVILVARDRAKAFVKKIMEENLPQG